MVESQRIVRVLFRSVVFNHNNLNQNENNLTAYLTTVKSEHLFPCSSCVVDCAVLLHIPEGCVGILSSFSHVRFIVENQIIEPGVQHIRLTVHNPTSESIYINQNFPLAKFILLPVVPFSLETSESTINTQPENESE